MVRQTLDAVAGVTQFLTILTLDRNKLKGVFEPFYSSLFLKMRLNVTYVNIPISPDGAGECDVDSICSGQTGELVNTKHDFALIGISTKTFKFADKIPIILGPPFIETESHIFSVPDEDLPDIVSDVIDSLKSVGYDVIMIYLIWSLVATWLMFKFTRVLNKKIPRRRRTRTRKFGRFFWETARALCDEDNFSHIFRSVDMIAMLIVISFFMFKQFYSGNFSTDLTISRKQFRINSLIDLITSNRVPVFLDSDTSLEEFVHYDNEIKRELYERFLIARKERTTHFYFTQEQYDSLMAALWNKSVALISVGPPITTVIISFCFKKSGGVIGDDAQQLRPGHISKETIHSELKTFVFHGNISDVLRTRLERDLQQLFETHVTEKAIVDDFPEQVSEEIGVEWTLPFQKCVLRIAEDAEQNPIPFKLRNTFKLFTYSTISLIISCLVLIIELLFNCLIPAIMKQITI